MSADSDNRPDPPPIEEFTRIVLDDLRAEVITLRSLHADAKAIFALLQERSNRNVAARRVGMCLRTHPVTGEVAAPVWPVKLY